jgi:hypothetical protein
MSADHGLDLPNLKGTILYKLLLEMGSKFSKRNKVKAIKNREDFLALWRRNYLRNVQHNRKGKC